MALAWLALLLIGCGTVNSYANGCPAVYSGLKTDVEFLKSYDSFSQDAFDWIVVAGDLPLSSVLDTVTFPLGRSIGGKPAQPLSLGCHWAGTVSEGGPGYE